jgi:hypothetical protein
MPEAVGSNSPVGSWSCCSAYKVKPWCIFCPPLYIFYAEEIEPIILVLKKAVLEQLTTILLMPSRSIFE